MKHERALASAVLLALRVSTLAGLTIALFNACASDAGGSTANDGRSVAGSNAAGAAIAASGASGAATSSGAGGAPTNGGAPAAGGSLGGSSAGAAGGAAVGGSAGAELAGAGGTTAGAPGSAGASNVAGAGGSAANAAGGSSGGGTAGGPPSNCGLPTPVSFQKNIQGFLTTSCGKAVSGGCHVTDTSKTSLGYDHAYDWITAVAHTSSCGKAMPYAKRFEVVLAVINGPNPPSCPSSRKMPPAGMGTPLTTCQVAALSAWLAEPMVSQMHVPETDDTKDMYPAGPYLMPPFN